MAKRAKSSKLNIFERIALEILWVLIWIVGHLPHWFQFYILAPVVKFFTYRVACYRVKVVNQNLRNCFPEKSEAELSKIRSGYYTYLSEAIVSTIAVVRKSSYDIIFDWNDDSPRNENAKRMRESIDGRSWIALAGHFGLWEYLLCWKRFGDQQLLGVYHPLENLFFDVLFERVRRRMEIIPLAAKDTGRFAMANGKIYRDRTYALGLIADQNPPLLKKNNWYDFLGQPTVFFEGGEKLAMKIGLPVYFVYQRRLSPGRYQFLHFPVWDGEEEVAPTEITRRYVRLLEEQIYEVPDLWLWSHRRWKHKRTAENSTSEELIH